MANSIESAIDPEPTRASWLLEQAINNLSLGLIIFDNKREVVFCNKRYGNLSAFVRTDKARDSNQ
jgi:hypothetical protein